MLLPLSECARLTGISRSGLLKAIRRGTLSASRDESNGQWVVDSSELSRVYRIIEAGEQVRAQTDTTSAVLESEVKFLRETVNILENERNDLRRRLDAESEERRKLTALITGPRPDGHSTDNRPRTLIPYVVGTLAGVLTFVAILFAGYFLIGKLGQHIP